MTRSIHRLALVAFGLVAALAAVPARAAGPFFDRPVDVQRLASARGGFAAADGALTVSFRIQRAVQVDGAAVATAADAATLLLVQRGQGNRYGVASSGGAVGTVLQNTLDNQKLQTVTTLDVTATSLQAFRSLAWQASLRSSITDSLRR